MTTAEAIAEMMAAWEKIEADVKARMPDASPEDVYQACKTAMDAALGF